MKTRCVKNRPACVAAALLLLGAVLAACSSSTPPLCGDELVVQSMRDMLINKAKEELMGMADNDPAAQEFFDSVQLVLRNPVPIQYDKEQGQRICHAQVQIQFAGGAAPALMVNAFLGSGSHGVSAAQDGWIKKDIAYSLTSVEDGSGQFYILVEEAQGLWEAIGIGYMGYRGEESKKEGGQ